MQPEHKYNQLAWLMSRKVKVWRSFLFFVETSRGTFIKTRLTCKQGLCLHACTFKWGSHRQLQCCKNAEAGSFCKINSGDYRIWAEEREVRGAVHYRFTLRSDAQRACLTVLVRWVSTSEQVEDADRPCEKHLFRLGQLLLLPLHFLVFKVFMFFLVVVVFFFPSSSELIVCCWPREKTDNSPSQQRLYKWHYPLNSTSSKTKEFIHPFILLWRHKNRHK